MAAFNDQPPAIEFANFTYADLPSESSIRLLSLIRRPRQLSPPSILGEPLLEYVLETVEVSSAPQFDLISSTWGNPNSAHPGDIDAYGPMHRYPIAVNGKILFVPRNIYEALQMAKNVNDPIGHRDDVFGETELIRATESNHLPKVRELLQEGAHVHAQDIFGKTAIHHAAENGHFEIVSILLDYGASMDVIDSRGRTPLEYFPHMGTKQWNQVEEIAYKIHQPPEARELVPVPEVVWVGRPMWIDAICVDQSNDDEKSSCSSMIGKIYRHAHSVVAWIGVPDDDTQLGRQAIISFLQNRKQKSPDHTMSDDGSSISESGKPIISSKEKSSITQFLRRSWFERSDLINEVAFGRAIAVYCGTDSIPLSDVLEFLRRNADDESLPSDLQVWSLLGSRRSSKKRRSYGSGGNQKRTRLDED
ncbi:Serine/threonine-protein phosphatase 6 regulatory ankyrin repeat subunit A [Fusarium austroafricanum]|uniref:Serine/threonine-protein phosphatase 6 regulatory ankyrin repeat subunit A n=1 Tax=Fusarium austroafricanum TaxID=2364996 RepID=A0A8H4NCX6_9HYPO|nr:Serine/threonine-protein phosphatase 6 regulatory ankyrin repeat subunit A [Fusarium austroafricanum]